MCWPHFCFSNLFKPKGQHEQSHHDNICAHADPITSARSTSEKLPNKE